MALTLYANSRDTNETPQPATAIKTGGALPVDQKRAEDLNELGKFYVNKEDYIHAIRTFEDALHIGETAFGAEGPQLAPILLNLAYAYRNLGKFNNAEPLYQRARSILETNQSDKDNQTALAGVLHGLATLYDHTGQYQRAWPLHQQALELYRAVEGSQSLKVAVVNSDMASHFFWMGDPVRAEQLENEALQIKENAEAAATRADDLRRARREIAHSLNHLALLCQEKGNYNEAEKYYLRALSKIKEAVGEEHLEVAQDLDNLAGFYLMKGDREQALKLRKQALQMAETKLPPEDVKLKPFLVNVGDMLRSVGAIEEARAMHQRALAIGEHALGPDNPQNVDAMSALAQDYSEQGRHVEEAERLYQRSLTIYERETGPESIRTTGALHNLARFYRKRGDFHRAITNYEKAIAIEKRKLGECHPNVGESVFQLAIAVWGTGDVERAVSLLDQANAIKEHYVRHTLVGGSEKQKRLYIDSLKYETSISWTLLSEAIARNPAIASSAMTLALQQKGRVLDVMAGNIATLRRRASAKDRVLLDELLKVRSQRAALVDKHRQTEGGKDLMSELEQREQVLDAQISDAQYRAESEPITLAGVQQALPSDTALVEFIEYRQVIDKGQSWTEGVGDPKYVALVLLSQGDPKWVELGEANKIDSSIANLRRRLSDSQEREADPKALKVKEIARKLDAAVMQRIRCALGSARHILVAPDGALNLIPFGLLVDEEGRYLVERYEVSYLTSGRDLIRLKAAGRSRMEEVVIADPNYDLRGKDRSKWKRVRWTGEQAESLRKLLPRARVRTEDEATEGELRAVAGPRLLHVATHGFFSAEQEKADTRAANDPMLRSGLVLAGANGANLGDDDGLMKALEVSALDLWGTRLVMLSACETAVGEVHSGEGVYGLRRALVLAGAETQIMSLWNVKGTSALELVIGYYKSLAKGLGRSEALTEIQRRMLANGRHPYFWGVFISSGVWTPVVEKPGGYEVHR